MDIIRLYRDFNIEHHTEGHKHCRPGWVNCECPFCVGNPGFHLGWNINEEFFVCWRCGWHSTVHTISQLTGTIGEDTKKILIDYGINRTVINAVQKSKKKFTLPTNSNKTNPSHWAYLQRRDFDSYKIMEDWKILGTGPISKLGNLDYKFRIIIPYFWNGQMVSFDSRDITEKAINKYQACPSEYEIIPHKSILYGNQEWWDPNIGICVEGPTDVWRIGKQAFATSGIKYTPEQVRVMSNIFKKIVVVFDPEPQAQIQAKKLVAELKFRGVNAMNIKIDASDPGSMTNKQVKNLLKEIYDKK